MDSTVEKRNRSTDPRVGDLDRSGVNEIREVDTEELKSKVVSMRFQPDTLRNVQFLKEATGVENRTQITVDAIGLAKWYVEKMREGAKVYAEYPDGSRESVVMPRFESK